MCASSCVCLCERLCVCVAWWMLTILAGSLSPQSQFHTPSSLPNSKHTHTHTHTNTHTLTRIMRACTCKLKRPNSHICTPTQECTWHLHPSSLSTHTHTHTHFVHVYFSALFLFCPRPSLPFSSISLSLSSFAQLLAMNYVLYPYGVRKVSSGLSFPT